MLSLFIYIKNQCFKSGCYGQICGTDFSNDCPDLKPEFSCYKDATCKMIDNTCKFDMTQDLQNCLNESRSSGKICKTDGCWANKDVCYEHNGIPPILSCSPSDPAPPENECYKLTTCQVIKDDCGFDQNDKFTQCLKDKKQQCRKSGCYKELCTNGDFNMASHDCGLYDAKFECYKKAECAMQADGSCGFNKSDDLDKCLAIPPTQCHVTGCNAEKCVDSKLLDSVAPNAAPCVYDKGLACYRFNNCGLGSNGQCRWEYTKQYEKCMYDYQKSQDEANTINMNDNRMRSFITPASS
jgi:hypothetical protein